MRCRRPIKCPRGQGAVEYAIVLSLIAAVVIVAVALVGRSTKSSLCSVSGGLAGGLTCYSATVLADRPVAYWRMDESSGTVAADSSGNDHQGTYNGPVTLGQPGATADSDAAMALAGAGWMSSTVPASATLTVEVWARSSTPTWGAGGLIATARVDNGWIIHSPGGTTAITVYLQPPTQQWTVACMMPPPVTVPPFDITKWHQYALTFDGATATGYIDGVSRCSAPFPSPLSNTGSVAVLFGKDDYATARFLTGALDEVAIYNTALTAAQMAAHFRAATG